MLAVALSLLFACAPADAPPTPDPVAAPVSDTADAVLAPLSDTADQAQLDVDHQGQGTTEPQPGPHRP